MAENIMGTSPSLDVAKGQSIDTQRLSAMVAQAAESTRKCKLRSSSLAQLRVSNMRLHGREDDLKYLKSKLRELKSHVKARPETETILVSGVSGSGKSALVTRGLRDPAEQMGVAFAGGKFDLNNKALPMSAFAEAMHALTTHVLDQNDVDKIKMNIDEMFGEDDTAVLLRAMPGCADLFSSKRPKASRRQSLLVGRETIASLQYAIRTLLKVVCTHLKGLILFLDDLQWSDTATLDLLESISRDSEIPSLLLVGAYRDDEVPDTHPLAIHIRQKEKARTAVINIGNLCSSNVKSLVAEALGMEDDEDAVDTLASTVCSKTGGNPFFVLMFLRSLHEEGLIEFNFGAMKWLWDDDAVKAKLVTENIATAMISKLKRLRQVQQNILTIASCLGSRFSAKAVAMVHSTLYSDATDQESDCDDTESILSRSITDLENEGLWERDSEEIFHFSHDQVQSAAFELIPADKRDCFRGEMGNILMAKLDSDALETNLFEIVSLRNCAVTSVKDDERQELAKLNLRAGMKASEKGAFDAASVYFKAGRDLLGSWGADPGTMLELCSEGAHSCFINGDLDQMNMLVDEVMKQDIPVSCKGKVYDVKILAAMAEGNLIESIEIALDARRQLGLRAPQNKPVKTFTIVKEYMKTLRVLKNRTPGDIENLPELKDERIIMGQKMLSSLGTSSFQVQPTLFPLLIFVQVQASIKYGINPNSCDGFAGYGVLLCVAFGQMQRGREMAKATELIIEKFDAAHMKSRSTFINEAMIYHWTSPLQGTIEPLLGGYQSGLESGDTESACWNLCFRCSHLLHSGKPLEALEHELVTSVRVIGQLNQVGIKMRALAYLLAVRKLRGVELEEEGMDFDAIAKAAMESSNHTLRCYPTIAQLTLLVIHQNWRAAAEVLANAGDVRTGLTGLFCMVRFTFLEALVCLKTAQDSSSWSAKRKWKQKGLKSMKLLRGWVKKGNVNVVHIQHLLEAELAVLEGKCKRAEDGFKSAISVSSKNGFLQDRALAHELASKHCATQGDEYWVRHHFESARKCYLEWGATAKANELATLK